MRVSMAQLASIPFQYPVPVTTTIFIQKLDSDFNCISFISEYDSVFEGKNNLRMK